MSESNWRKVSDRKPIRRHEDVALSPPGKQIITESSPEQWPIGEKDVSKVIQDDDQGSSQSSGRRHKSSRKQLKAMEREDASPSRHSKRDKCGDGDEREQEQRRRRKKKEKRQKRETESGDKPRKNKKPKHSSPRSLSPEEIDESLDDRMMRPPTSGGICRSTNKDEEESSKHQAVVDEKKKKRVREESSEDHRSRQNRREERRREEVPRKRSRSPRRDAGSRGWRDISKSERQREYQTKSPSEEKRFRPSERSSNHRTKENRSHSRSVSKTSVDKIKTSSGLPSLLSKRSRTSVGNAGDNQPILTLVRQLSLEETSDTEFAAVLPEGLVSGELAKLSMDAEGKTKITSTTTASTTDFQIGEREQQLEFADNFNKPQEDVEINENECLDRMLGSLSEELHTKGLSAETWDSTTGISSTTTDIDLEATGDLDPEEIGTLAASGSMTSALRLASASADTSFGRLSTTPLAQRLLSSLSIPWQAIVDGKNEEDNNDNPLDETSATSIDESQRADDQPVGLQFLSMTPFSTRRLGAVLTTDLREKVALCTRPLEVPAYKKSMPHIFPSLSDPVASPAFPSLSFPVPTVDAEVTWRSQLLCLPAIAL